MRLVGSMTTLPPRLSSIAPTILAILTQQKPLDVLYLNIPYTTLKGMEYTIPDGFVEQFRGISSTQFIINRCKKDLGPLTKLAPVLYIEKDPDTLIFTFDDDVIVQRDIVELLYKKSLKYPKSCLGLSGVCIGYFPFYYQVVVDNDDDVVVDWLQGVHVVAYQRSALGNPDDLIVFGDNTDIKDLLVFNDDHRISAYLNSRGVQLISIGVCALEYIRNPQVAYNIHDALSKRGMVWLTDHQKITSTFMEMGLYNKEYHITRSVFFIAYIIIIAAIVTLISAKFVYTNGTSNIGYLIGSIYMFGMLVSVVRSSIFMTNYA